MLLLIVNLFLIFNGCPNLQSQDFHPISIHEEQNIYYSAWKERKAEFYDSLNQFQQMPDEQTNDCQLQRIVFGYQPFWMGSTYLNYQWNLLSDLCYFSYEVNASTGEPVTFHNWLTDPAIDHALANGVRVHLCVTLFSGHTSFFTNPVARQTLIANLISLLQQRNAHGINIDFEAVPSSQGDNLTSFIQDLSVQLKSVLPASILSIAIPAINWSNTFRIQDLEELIDLFMVMGYDYYWNGSTTAGPVTPLYSLTPSYDYSLSRTISAYQAEGIPDAKLVLGIPYYGRQWLTRSNTVPSPMIANGIALTYANIRNNGGGNYNLQNYAWEPKSLSSYYVFFQNNNWNQCFIGLDRDVRKWYDIVNNRQLAGIGIWALGYDNGYSELWQAISDKFTGCYIPLTYDTLYDSGGPVWNYYVMEDYRMTVDHGYDDMRWLSFLQFDLEEGYDSLWLYAGPDTSSLYLGGFSGTTLPGSFSSPDGIFTLKFKSDGLGNRPGWMAVYHNGTLGINQESVAVNPALQVYPNPAGEYVIITLPDQSGAVKIMVYDLLGKLMVYEDRRNTGSGWNITRLELSGWAAGIYSVWVVDDSAQVWRAEFIKY